MYIIKCNIGYLDQLPIFKILICQEKYLPLFFLAKILIWIPTHGSVHVDQPAFSHTKLFKFSWFYSFENIKNIKLIGQICFLLLVCEFNYMIII